LGGIEALTASERRVAGLAAERATNREIAQALFVTPKTVELHLGNAYRKLGIRSRHDLDGKRTKSSRSACATDVAAPGELLSTVAVATRWSVGRRATAACRPEREP